MISEERIAIIDTETNYSDEVMSIGIVVADRATLEPQDKLYLVLDPEWRKPAMFSAQLDISRARIGEVSVRKDALKRIEALLQSHGVKELFAYNGRFDKTHLPELRRYIWHDIMRVAAYRQYNRSIPSHVECCRTGRMKSGYRAQDIYRMLSGKRNYHEAHNALADAEDELEIMRMLGQEIDIYQVARI